jgi:hypothetical protein
MTKTYADAAQRIAQFNNDLQRMEDLCRQLSAKDGKTYRPIVQGAVVISNAVEEVMRPKCPTCGR